MTSIFTKLRRVQTSHRPWCLLGVLVVAALAGCGGPAPAGSGAPDRFVVIDAEELGRFNPLTGHGSNGESKIYESLYRVAEGQDNRIPDAVPVLAEGAPAPVGGDLKHWRVQTRTGVTFSDGSTFGPEDVVATYNAEVNPAFAAPIAANFDFLRTAEVSGPNSVDLW